MSNELNLTIGGTAKLNGIRHFSISRESCNYSTEMCRKYCYGSKGNFLNPCVIAAYNENYEASKQEDFIDKMILALSINERFFRIHAVGDFYDLDYFEKWCEIAQRTPHIIFLAFTRNHEVFDYHTEIPENLRLFFSIDDSTDWANVPVKARKARVIPSEYKREKHLNKLDSNLRVCTVNDCMSCGAYCWLGSDDIAFPQKYPKHD